MAIWGWAPFNHFWRNPRRLCVPERIRVALQLLQPLGWRSVGSSWHGFVGRDKWFHRSSCLHRPYTWWYGCSESCQVFGFAAEAGARRWNWKKNFWHRIGKNFLHPQKFFFQFWEPMALRKHLGARATPPLIEQHLLVNSWGPKPGSQECDAFVSKSVVTFMEKERRLATKGGPLVSKKDLRLPRKRALRSDKGAKRKSYIRKKTKTSELTKAPNARCLARNGSAAINLEEPPEDAARPSILDKMSPLKKRKKEAED